MKASRSGGGCRTHDSCASFLHRIVGTAAAVLVWTATERASGQPPQQAAAVPAAVVTFTDVAASAGVRVTHVNDASEQKHLPETIGSGGAFIDYDGDGWLDIFLVDGGSIANAAAARARHRLFQNRRNGTFTDVTASSGIRHRGYGMGVCAGDYDGDRLVDLYITNVGPNTLYRNVGDGTFRDVTSEAGVGIGIWSTSCAFGDLDRDGDLDLFVTNYVELPADSPFCGDARGARRSYCHPLKFKPLQNTLYRNDGNGAFTDVTTPSGIAAFRGNGLGTVLTDVDLDGLPDVFVANDALPNYLFINKGGLEFEESALLAGVAVASDGRARAGMGVDAGDYDGDGRLDLVVTNHEHETTSLYRNLGGRLFTYATPIAGLAASTRPFVGFGLAFLDYDNDAALDLAVANGHVMDNISSFGPGTLHGQRNLLLRNVNGRFEEVGARSGTGFAPALVSRGLATGDMDNDGDIDLLITNNGGPANLLRNDAGSRLPSLLVQLAGRTNTSGIGARIHVTAGGRTQVREVHSGASFLSQSDSRAHFGLGTAHVVERLEVRWPGGAMDAVENVPVNQTVVITEGRGLTARRPYEAGPR